MFFPSNVVIFLNSASSAAALVFYLPGVCTHTDTEGKQSSEYSKKIGKNTIFNRHPVDDGMEPKKKVALGTELFYW